jgi:hypothetical protein
MGFEAGASEESRLDRHLLLSPCFIPLLLLEALLEPAVLTE